MNLNPNAFLLCWQIWSEGCKPADSDGIELPDSRWGLGSIIRTVLVAPSGEVSGKQAIKLKLISEGLLGWLTSRVGGIITKIEKKNRVLLNNQINLC